MHKAFASRPQDWVDIEGVILKQRGVLVWSQLWSDLAELSALKGEAAMLETLEQVITRAERVVGPFAHAR